MWLYICGKRRPVMKNKFRNCILPGYNYEGEKTTFIVMMILSGFCCLIYDYRYSTARNRLYDWNGKEKVLNVHAVMPDFADLLGWTLWGFLISAGIMLIYIGVRYNYLHQESKSIYLMRRLPSKGEIFRRCAVIPLAEALLFVLCWLVLLLLFFAIYMISTPDECLTPGQWSKIWEVRL